MRQPIKAMQQIAADKFLPDPAPPRLAILAADDLLFPLDLAGASVNTIPGAGHFVQCDAPEAVLAEMIAHLAMHAGTWINDD